MPAPALPRGVQAVLVTSGQLRNLDPQLQVPPLLLANTLIAAFSRAALPHLALPLLRHILRRAHPFRPDAFTFPPLVRAAPGHASATQLHACALRLGLAHPCVFASGSLVHAYLRFGRVSEAYRVFDEMTERDLPAWNAMLSGLCRNARAAEAVRLFGRMAGEGVAGDTVTVSSVLPMCALLGDWVLALVMHVYAVKHGLDKELIVCNAMVDVYGKLGMLDEARRVFDGMERRDLVTWNSIISGYEQCGQVASAVKMLHGMRDSGISPDVLTLVSLASAVAQCGDERGGKSVHCHVTRRGWDVGDIIAGNAMVDMYAKLSKIEAAQRMFDIMPVRDAVSWNTLITGYMQNGLANEAIEAYSHMQKHEGLKPIQGTIVSVLPAYSQLGALQQGMRMHALSVKTGFNLDVYIGTCMVDLYAKCGKLADAMLFFEKMHKRSTGPWNAIMAGLGVHGHADKALSVFSRMQQEGVNPDHVTFVSLLAACSHAGLVDQGRSFFDMMHITYGIIPIAKHYACMVDMLGRAGQLQEAFDFIHNMPIKPDSAVWGALLGACRIHGNVEMGKVASQNLFELDPENVGYYVLMSNMYAKVGKWDGVDEVRSLVRHQNLQKTPGWSSVEVKRLVNVFYSGNQTEPHPQHDEIQAELQNLLAKMRTIGYVPDYSFVLQDQTHVGPNEMELEQEEHSLPLSQHSPPSESEKDQEQIISGSPKGLFSAMQPLGKGRGGRPEAGHGTTNSSRGKAEEAGKRRGIVLPAAADAWHRRPARGGPVGVGHQQQ
ncbi:pentatricopeptide repeat-containing protein [Hordeum vulgare]|nr:pentatricopeptide repeat-containing protein [Hordeum vulgare]